MIIEDWRDKTEDLRIVIKLVQINICVIIIRGFDIIEKLSFVQSTDKKIIQDILYYSISIINLI